MEEQGNFYLPIKSKCRIEEFSLPFVLWWTTIRTKNSQSTGHTAWSKADLHILVPRAHRSRILTEQGGTTHMKVETRHSPALCRTRSKRTINTRTDIDICSLSQLT